MSEEKDPNLNSSNDSCSRRKDLEEALAVWEDVGKKLKKLLAGVPEDLSVRELESKTEKLLSLVKAIEGERQHTFNVSLKHESHAEISEAGLEPVETETPARSR